MSGRLKSLVDGLLGRRGYQKRYEVHLVYGSRPPRNLWEARARSLAKGSFVAGETAMLPVERAGTGRHIVLLDPAVLVGSTRPQRQAFGFGIAASMPPAVRNSAGGSNDVLPVAPEATCAIDIDVQEVPA